MPACVPAHEVFTFHLGGEPWAVRLVAPEAADEDARPARLVEAARAGEPGFERLEGFDTFWYTWVGVNEKSRLLR